MFYLGHLRIGGSVNGNTVTIPVDGGTTIHRTVRHNPVETRTPRVMLDSVPLRKEKVMNDLHSRDKDRPWLS